MTYTEFFNIITDNSFDREKYYYILKKCGYRRTKEYFNKFITDYENNDENIYAYKSPYTSYGIYNCERGATTIRPRH